MRRSLKSSNSVSKSRTQWQGKNLINLQRVSLEEACVCRYDVSELDADDVPWHEDGRIFLGPSAIAKNLKIM